MQSFAFADLIKAAVICMLTAIPHVALASNNTVIKLKD